MNAPELPLSDDPEEVHTWREIVRRLRCALSIGRVALDPRAAEVRRELGQFAKTMAAARDIDVQSAHVRTQADSADPAESSGYEEVLSLLSDMRNAARAEMLASLSAHPNPQMITTVAELAKRRGLPIPRSSGNRCLELLPRSPMQETPRVSIRRLRPLRQRLYAGRCVGYAERVRPLSKSLPQPFISFASRPECFVTPYKSQETFFPVELNLCWRG